MSTASTPSSLLPTTVGERLRLAREQAGLSVARVAEETCLSPAFIGNLEEGNYADLLPLAFSRSYVRRLCEMYCLPEEETVGLFVREYKAKRGGKESSRPIFHVAPDGDDGASKVVYVPNEMNGEEEQDSRWSVGNVVVGLMVLVAVALSVATITLFVLRYMRPDTPAPEPLPVESATGAQPTTPPPVDLRRFILPEELPLDELPVPK